MANSIRDLNKISLVTFTPDTTNEIFQLAIRLVNQSNRNIFLTGKAGTGKTTFLKYIRQHCPKQMAIVAPTGVAAINAGGVTIHSFFQLPLSPFIPETRGTGFKSLGQEISNKHSLISRLRFSSEKKKVLQEMELLVIDEISMVRCDTLDAIDTVLRHIRHKPRERFGGIQVLFIGDMLQLPPVIKDEEWELLSEYYKSAYFFDSQVLLEEPPLYIEFNKIYRQSDEQFINLLNQVRNNELDDEGLKILENRFQPGFRRHKRDGYIILTTHNNKAAEINNTELAQLRSPLFTYEAEVQDEFSERAYPADQLLYLKAGAQVMFIRNDSSEKGKRYFNGKIGTVTKLEEKKIFVKCDDDGDEIEVSREKWENIRYSLNKTTRQLDSEVLGSFTQFPLRLAWAITIHKSQGLTFEKAIIDAGEAFAPGQVYVALSRCTNLEGLVLQSRVRSSSFFSDKRIVEFSQRSVSGDMLQRELDLAKKNYQQSVLVNLFDFSVSINSGKELLKYLVEHTSSFNPESFSWTEELLGKTDKLQETANKFQGQLQTLFLQTEIPEANTFLEDRIKAASNYFATETSSLIQFIQNSPAVTDSRLHSKEFIDNLQEIYARLAMKKFMFEGLKDGFEIEAYNKQKLKFVLPPISVNAYAGSNQKRVESPHPVLYQQLKKLRDSICARKDMPIYFVAGSNTIDEMARYLPQTLTELRKISGFGDSKIQQYGQGFLDIIVEYCTTHKLSTLIHEKTPKKERKRPASENQEIKEPLKKRGDTYAESFRLYKEGKKVEDIARERNLAINTVEGHLAKFVSRGDIGIHELVNKDKFLQIESALKDFDGTSVTPVKQQLGEGISYGEIKLVMAALGINQRDRVK